MIWLILAIVCFFVAYKLVSSSKEIVESVKDTGGMRIKYSKLLAHILDGHKDAKVFVETRTYLRAGVSNYGGTTIFHIQQCPNNRVMIEYEVKNNPAISDFSLKFSFDDSMNQDQMMEQICLGVKQKMENIMHNGLQ